MKSHARSLILLSLGAVAALVVSCNLDTDATLNGLEGGGSSSPVTTSPVPAPTLQGSNGFTFSGTDFFVNVSSPTGTTMYLHQDGDWTQPCRSTLAQVGTGVDMTCILEAQELDLYFNGINLVWQGPQLQCNYVQVIPYSFYQFQPGVGPTVVNATQVTGDPPVITSVSGGTTTAFVNSSGTINCGTDYSEASPVAGPNCCQGNYTYNLTSDGTLTTTTVSWGGNASNCMVGPAMATQTKNADGFPLPSISFLEGGTVNSSYVVAAPISKPYASNVMVSNYFCPAGICPSGTSFPDAEAVGTSLVPSIVGVPGTGGYALADAPAAMQFAPAVGTTGTIVLAALSTISGITSTSGISYDNMGDTMSIVDGMFVFGPGVTPGTTVTAVAAHSVSLSAPATLTAPVTASYTFSSAQFPSGQPWYEFDCMDNAEDYIARLRVLVRSWTTAAAFNAAMTSNGAFVAAAPPTLPSGAEPIVCGPEFLFPDQPLYDRNMWPSCTSSLGTQGFANDFPAFGL